MADVIVGGARRSLNSDERCGDAYAWWRNGTIWTICLIDGLGHGTQAADASEAALAHAETLSTLSPIDLIETISQAIAFTRGAAIAVVQVDGANRTLCYAGIGNVRAGLFDGIVQRFDGTPGIVGTGHKPPLPETVSWRDGDLLLLWTDGFDARLKLDASCLRLRGEPEALARHLLEAHSTRRDDAAVVCCLLEGAAP